MSGDSKRQEVFDLALKGDLQQVVVRAKEDNRQARVNFRTDISRVPLCDINFAGRDADISTKNHKFCEFIMDKRLGISERDKQHMV